ncbi:MAG: thioredoxin family protein [Ignavibacteriae bacterium]|nr:MAG: thioredoxin family protein [Ignavibacteriota bacterium]
MTQIIIQRLFLSIEIIVAFILTVKFYLFYKEWKLRLRSRTMRLPDSIESGKPVLLYFWTSDCAQCKPQERQIERAKNILQQSGKTLNVQKLNALKEHSLAAVMNVMTVPTTVLLDSEGTVTTWNPGLTPAESIVSQYLAMQEK